MRCDIEGVIIRELRCVADARGWLTELFRRDELPGAFEPAMSYVSMTRPGVVRGPHEHRDQSDLFCFLGPSTFRLYLWDSRPGAPSHGRTYRAEFGEHRRALVIVPPGVVHAYKNVGAVDGLVFNAPNRLYAGEGRREPVDEIRHENDPASPFRIDD
ncbi:MAG TPA: dTDP-4-dehydrorhamnose 3,5-epimerase family protein [candidate division Zixibacteria bacterium]|nr:dTDP-4-dehydrorhamnose 3,5-epimerase family protein [candidate division Zixibacteria bacterium]MDD4918742.1 dTDP-4-dehydrorhamnose 3,5-epimerase family protein [candidate division Zixibacteria bacterium]MDM7971593.1 dTDP-4-dehydrorhamnose 3,5-epimerase family protein [candidate division Zixibacteria bacterium]HOD67047.1 dTDP-4-dehydrorhamnose 3,5-epimerase family protein [candidate division Zixibacteria bacterium]HOZ07263.1 dTDP-4-dehydrorhamnose 3,5-epimerase family protein [candidate divis